MISTVTMSNTNSLSTTMDSSPRTDYDKQEAQGHVSKNGNDHDEQGPLQIDLGKIKTEPLDNEYVPECPESKLQAKQNISEALTEQIVQRLTKSRYFRRNYSSPESSVCEVCQAEFGGPDVLRLHKIAHFNTTTVCYVCDSMFVDENGQPNGSKMTHHMITHHKTLCTPTGHYKPEAERAFVCPICLQRFSSNKILGLHTLRQHNTKEVKTISCKICSIDFVSNRNLQAHLMGRHHKDMKVKIQSLFVCVDCRSIFPARDSYAMHMMMRAQNESCTPLEGPVKGITFPEPAPIMAPPKSSSPMASPNAPRHSSPKENAIAVNGTTMKADHHAFVKGDYSCDLCHLKFYHPDTLNIHIRMAHTGTPDLALIHRLASQQLTARITPPSVKTLGKAPALNFTSDMNWPCTTCGQLFHTCDALAMHVMDKHTGPTRSAYSNVLDIRAMVQEKLKHQLFQQRAATSAESTEFKLPIIRPDDAQIQENPERSNDDENTTKHVTERQENGVSDEAPKNKYRRLSPEPGEIPPKEDEQQFYSKCSFCQKPFNCRDSLIAHLKSCTPKLPILACLSCRKSFDTIKHFQSHECYDKHVEGNLAACLTCEEKLDKSMQDHFDDKQNCIQLPMLQPVSDVATMNATKEMQNGTNDRAPQHEQCIEHDINASAAIDEAPNAVNGATSDTEQIEQEHICNGETHDEPSTPDDALNDSHEKDSIIKSLVQDAVAMKKNRRKNRTVTRVLNNSSPEPLSEHDHECSKHDHSSPTPHDVPFNVASQSGLIAIPISPASSPTLKDALPALNSAAAAAATNGGSGVAIDATGHENLQGQALFNFVLTNSPNLIMCKYCEVIFTNRTMYYLHMGLHNLNNPWQCNLCGKVCANVHEFSSHVIHYR